MTNKKANKQCPNCGAYNINKDHQCDGLMKMLWQNSKLKREVNEDNCPICGRPLVALEYSYDNPNHYDGISEYFCPQPDPKTGTWHYRIGRWSGQILKKGECDDWSTQSVVKLKVKSKNGKNKI